MRITGYIVSLIVALSSSISYGSESKIGDTLILTVEKETIIFKDKEVKKTKKKKGTE